MDNTKNRKTKGCQKKNEDKMMSVQDKMTQYTNFSPHQWFEHQDQQSKPSNIINFETQRLK